jgi:ATP-dependent Clp protease ATP-binding subunit ClpA
LYASGFLDQRRPRGRFLFLGPPGVGKTELASTLADEVLRDRGSVISVNMGDYRKEDALGKFMGASPGYVGFGQTPTLYSKVMMRPYSVVILDEFEKASPELANPLLAILDGSAEDSQGRFVDFSQCIFVLTSNAIMSAGDGIPGASEDAIRDMLLEAGGIWTMPLVDRIDRVVLFDPIGTNVLYEILDRMIESRRRVATRALPPSLDTQEARDAIVASAATGGASPSARRLERSLLAWLSDSASI